jgi:S-layer homology domain
MRKMRTTAFALMLSASTLAADGPASAQPRSPAQRLPRITVPFVENCGQWDERVAFAVRTEGGTVFITPTGQLVYSMGSPASGAWTLTETAMHGRPAPHPEQPAATRVSFFRGDDPSRWRSGLASYDAVDLGEVWTGIDVALRAGRSTIEKALTIHPGARPERIRFRIGGANSLFVGTDGSLVALTDSGQVRFTPPRAFQVQDGSTRAIDVAYVVRGKTYGFRLGRYDHRVPIVIDPLLQSTYLGGSDFDYGGQMAIDPSTGNVYLVGGTVSIDFPGTAGGAQPSSGGGGEDAVAAILDPTLTTLLQATYLGGSGQDAGVGIAIHPSNGDVFIVGTTFSVDFPGATGGFQPAFAGGDFDLFVARLDPTLTTLVQSSYYGGSQTEGASGLVIAPESGEIVLLGTTDSFDLPGVAGGAQETKDGIVDAFVARIDPSLTALLQATYLGGSDHQFGGNLAIDPSNGDVLVVGATTSSDFPGTAGGAQSTSGGGDDLFAARLDPTLTTLIQSTYLGGSADEEEFAAVAIQPTSGEVIVAGGTKSSDFPGTVGGAQPVYAGTDDGFVVRLNPSLTSILQSTYLGGGSTDIAENLVIDPTSSDVFVSGFTASAPFPGSFGGAQPAGDRIWDSFVARLDPTLTTLVRSTYLGGSGSETIYDLKIDPTGTEVLVAGSTTSTDFPATAGGAQSAYAGGAADAFVARFTLDLAAILAPVSVSVDPLPDPGNGDSILEPGETVPVVPSWQNLTSSPLSPNGQATSFTGPPGATYTIVNGAVSYSTIAPGAVGLAGSAYAVSVSAPSPRPAIHWDAVLTETLDVAQVLPFRHVLHIADSFPDVSRSNPFYRHIETVLHNEVTSGCGGGNYCPDGSTTRAQMAIFVLKSKHGLGYLPPHCSGIFGDVPCPSGFPVTIADWVEELFHEGITGGCGGGNYCPDESVTRAQMAVLLLKAEHGPSYVPPTCGGIFGDVACPSQFADWIEQLSHENVTGGCGGGNYCPSHPNTRGQMAVFLVKTFGLQLYGR